MWGPSTRAAVALALADAFLGGDWTRDGLLDRGARVTGRRSRWLISLVDVVAGLYVDRPADRPRELRAVIARELDSLATAGRLTQRAPRIHEQPLVGLEMGRRRWPVPEITDLRELAGFLALREGELDWLADVRGLERTVGDEPLRNYRYRWQPRRSGRPRLIEQPKRLLKESQRRVLHDILDPIPPHHAAHGFRRGHSAMTNARRHVAQRVVIGFDLEDFFASVTAARVYGIFRSAGYPQVVAHRLTALCTNEVPTAVWDAAPRPSDPRNLGSHHRLGRALSTPHLPQGAPTSPALANLSAYRLDCRLGGLAVAIGAAYSRYADDITLSGDAWLIGHAEPVRTTVAAIVADCGFRLNAGKSRLTTKAGRQTVTGVVVNARPNPVRRDYDRLKAILHNAARDGAAAANRNGHPHFRDHLLGQIAWVASLNPERGRKLRRLWAQVDWGA